MESKESPEQMRIQSIEKKNEKLGNENKILKAKNDILLRQNRLLKEQNEAYEKVLSDVKFLDAEVRNLFIYFPHLMLI